MQERPYRVHAGAAPGIEYPLVGRAGNTPPIKPTLRKPTSKVRALIREGEHLPFHIAHDELDGPKADRAHLALPQLIKVATAGPATFPPGQALRRTVKMSPLPSPAE